MMMVRSILLLNFFLKVNIILEIPNVKFQMFTPSYQVEDGIWDSYLLVTLYYLSRLIPDTTDTVTVFLTAAVVPAYSRIDVMEAMAPCEPGSGLRRRPPIADIANGLEVVIDEPTATRQTRNTIQVGAVAFVIPATGGF